MLYKGVEQDCTLSVETVGLPGNRSNVWFTRTMEVLIPRMLTLLSQLRLRTCHRSTRFPGTLEIQLFGSSFH